VFESIGYFMLGLFGSAVGNVCFLFDFILHNEYTVDA